MANDGQQPQINSSIGSIPKPNSKTKKILAIIGIVAIVFVVGFGLLISKGFKDKPTVEAIIVEYMQSVSNQEPEKAYNDLASERFKSAVTLDEFVESLDLFQAQYSGFQELEFSNFTVRKYAGEPTIYEYAGIITYSNGDKGQLTADLEKENGEYKITGINVNVSVERARLFK